MGRVNEIAQRVGVVVENALGMSLIKQKDGQDLVKAIVSDGHVILGIERFVRVGQELRPDMNGIADFSDAISADESGRAAIVFLASLPDEENGLLEFNLDD